MNKYVWRSCWRYFSCAFHMKTSAFHLNRCVCMCVSFIRCYFVHKVFRKSSAPTLYHELLCAASSPLTEISPMCHVVWLLRWHFDLKISLLFSHRVVIVIFVFFFSSSILLGLWLFYSCFPSVTFRQPKWIHSFIYICLFENHFYHILQLPSQNKFVFFTFPREMNETFWLCQRLCCRFFHLPYFSIFDSCLIFHLFVCFRRRRRLACYVYVFFCLPSFSFYFVLLSGFFSRFFSSWCRFELFRFLLLVLEFRISV